MVLLHLEGFGGVSPIPVCGNLFVSSLIGLFILISDCFGPRSFKI